MNHTFAGPCPACGGCSLVFHPLLWDQLVRDWELSDYERATVDRQQSLRCTDCGNALRGMALAAAIMEACGEPGPLTSLCHRPWKGRLLEINQADRLTPLLRRLPGHVLAEYPRHDMQSLEFASGSFDMVVHSDTLEHIPDPLAAMAECLRVLRPGGTCVFTVPLVVGRLNRSRAEMPASYHGFPGVESEDQRVHTEFGADAWTLPLRAGFRSCRITALEFPAGLALTASRAEAPA